MKSIIAILLSVIATLVLTACGGGGTSDAHEHSEQNVPTPVTDILQSKFNYMLTAWNDLGMHCMDGKDFSVFSILPPYNNLHAQIKAKNGKLITTGVTLTYEAVKGTDGKTNTTSVGKTNFWEHSEKLFGVHLLKDTGIKGARTPSATPQKLTFNTDHQWWEAEGIPITPYNDDGSKNYYPLVKVVAKDSQGNVLSEVTTVLPVSDEMDCSRCHEKGRGSNAAEPRGGWVNNADSEKDYKFNILRLHDEKNPKAVANNINALKAKGYNYDPKGLETTAKNGVAILCASCHKTNALPNTGINGIKALTAAIHGRHAKQKDPVNSLSLNDINNRNACYTCHPGAQTKCLRGAMGDATDINGKNAIQCQSCHGDMEAVGSTNRKGWFDEPNCQACHHDGKRELSAIDPDANNTLKHVIDTKFATNTDKPEKGSSLYRYSKGHGGLQCEACHGATHAVFPAHEGDNILSKQIQGHAGTIGECSACHNPIPSNIVNGGPHSMHIVGQGWVKAHKHEVKHGAGKELCKSCHGQDYKGSPLSSTWANRSFQLKHGRQKNFEKGHKVSCFDCHSGPNGD